MRVTIYWKKKYHNREATHGQGWIEAVHACRVNAWELGLKTIMVLNLTPDLIQPRSLTVAKYIDNPGALNNYASVWIMDSTTGLGYAVSDFVTPGGSVWMNAHWQGE